MLPEVCGLSVLLSLPDDVFSIVSRSLTPRDLCNLSLCCRSLHDATASERIWLTQCEMVGILTAKDLIDWRTGVTSYKALCRFLSSIEPLMGIWVHQNPELGNVVYVMPGFVSVVGCRIIPQELGPLGIEDGPILWAPVFEIMGDAEGSASFCLHGREKGIDYFYPGLVKAVDKSCNVLLLEVDTRPVTPVKTCYGNLLHSKSFVNHSDQDSRKISRSNSDRSQSVFGQLESKVPFGRLAFSDRRKLLETVMSQVRVKIPNPVSGPLFPRLRDDEENFKKDMAALSKRRSVLLQHRKVGGSQLSWKGSSELFPNPTHLELSEFRKSLDGSSDHNQSINGDDEQIRCRKKKTLGRYFTQSLNHVLKKSGLFNDGKGVSKNGCSSSVNKYVQLEDFLKSGDTIGLALHASTMKLSSYRGWPNMHDSRFALYKLPMRAPTVEQEYAGLWGGTFGWPPGKPTEDKHGKALFFLLLSYEKSQEQLFLIATKILEGTHYVLHPNGSAMFRVNINEEPSTDPFPWESDGDLLPVNVQHTFTGEGIANGYGFRYPGSKPGSLYVFRNGQLAFIWKESKSVLTLQRLNLQDLLKKGERIPPLPPTVNFSYLTKSYSNVFAGFPNTSTSFSLPRGTCS